MTFQCLFTTYFMPLIPLVAALLAFWLAKSAYFRQKEYELITERYLRDGLDRVSLQVEKSLGIFRHNWAHSLTVVKLFRDAGVDMNKDLCKTGFIDPKTELFEYWADYRVRDLIGDDIVNNVRQSLDAFVRTSHTFFKEDLCTAVRLSVEGGKQLEVTAGRDEIVREYLAELDRLNTESNRYYILLGELQKLASVLQTERFSFKKIIKFRKSKVVMDSMKALKTVFAADVKEDPQKPINT
jgi:hypothetical protein